MIRSVIFDIDGVLINTLEGNRRFFNSILRELGKKPMSREEYAKFYSWTSKRVIDHFLPEKSEDEIDKIISNALKNRPKYFKYDKLNPHVAATLKELKSQFKLGIVTNRITPVILEHFKIMKYFDEIVCLPDVKKHKPHPEPILLALKKLETNPEEALYVGDVQSDANAGNSAGVKVIIYRNPLAKGDFNITDFREIEEIANKMKRKTDF